MKNLLCLSILLSFFFLVISVGLRAQVLDPNDPLVNYDSDNPPSRPTWGEVGKWARTPKFNQNADQQQAYIYKSINFRLLFPKNYTPGADRQYPLILFFHGKGARGGITDNESQLGATRKVDLDARNKGAYDGFVLYPQSYGSFSPTEQQELIELLNYMIDNAQVDPFRIHVHGLSNGGKTAWAFLLENPKLVASSQPMSATTTNPGAATINKIKYTAIWNSQGGLDRNPTPSGSRVLVNAIEKAGGNIRYTLYPDRGHNVWSTHYAEADFYPFMMRTNKVNPWPLFGKSEVCPGEPFDITLGLTPGFEAYQWRKNGTVISGATSHELKVTSLGRYDARIKRNGKWSYWSPVPVEVKTKGTTQTPPIELAQLHSRVIPSPDGRDYTVLELPEGFETYTWKQTDKIVGTEATLKVSSPGEYTATVTEEFGCASDASAPFRVVSADGANGPDPATGVSATVVSRTQLRVAWSDNPAAAYGETGFEIYRSTTKGGPYALVHITGANVLSYTDANLVSGQEYFYIVRAVNQNGASDVSEEVSATTDSDKTPPTTPPNLVVVSSTTNSVTLDWQESTDDTGVTTYVVYRNGTRSFATGRTAATVHNLAAGQMYDFTVRAADQAGNLSPESNQVTASTDNNSNAGGNPTNGFSVYINFSLSNEPASAPWNNTGNAPSVGNTYYDLSDESGANTGIDMSVVENDKGTTFAALGYKGVVTGDDSGIYPDEVLKSYWWIEQVEVATLRLSHLDLTMKYDLVFFASRAAGSRGTDYTVNGTTVTLDASNNTTETVEINGVVPNANGEIIINMRSMSGARLGYLGALVLEASPNANQDNARLAVASKDDVSAPGQVSTYPNPFDDQLFVAFAADEEGPATYQVTLFDLMGSTMYSEQLPYDAVQQGISIDLINQRLEAGNYVLRIGSDRGINKSIRLVKN